MADVALLIALLVVAVGVTGAAGLGPAAWLLPARGAALALAPLLGVALLGSLLVLAGTWLPARTSAWVVVLPVALGSLALGVAGVARRHPRPRLPRRGALGWTAVAAGAPAVAVAAPFAVTGSGGPVNLYAQDAWFFYVPLADWLGENRIGARLPLDFSPGSQRIADTIPAGLRVGFEEVLAALSALTGADEGRMLTPLLGALLVALACTLLALGRIVLELPLWVAAAAAAVATVSATLLVPVYESSGPATFALGALPVAVWLGGRAVDGDLRSAVAGGIAAAGAVAIYPEVLPALVLGVGVMVLARAVALARSGRARALPRGAGALAAGVALAALLSPPATVRAIDWLRYLRAVDLASSADWGIGPRNALPWVLGFTQLFEARRQSLMGDLRVGVLVLLSAAALATVAWFLLAGGPRAAGRTWLASLLAAGCGLAAYALWVEDCRYCFYRAAVYLAPVLTLGVAAGLVSIARSPRLPRRAAVAGSAVLAVVLAAGVIRGTVSAVDATVSSPALTPGAAWEAEDIVAEGADGRPVLVEGAESGYYYTASFFLAQALEMVGDAGARPLIDPDLNPGLYGGGYFAEGPGPYAPDYGLVVTRFGGMATNRRTIAVAEPFVVQERAPFDVGLVLPTYAVDPDTPADEAVPAISGPFTLTVASPRDVPLDVRLDFAGPREAEVRVAASAGGAPLPGRTVTTGGDTRACIRVTPDDGSARIVVDPGIAEGLPAYAAPDQAMPDPPGGVALVGLTAAPARSAACALGPAPDAEAG